MNADILFNLYSQVISSIPHIIGRTTAQDLIHYNERNSFLLELSYIHGILGFIRHILAANPDAIFDYTRPTTFNNTADRSLMGTFSVHKYEIKLSELLFLYLKCYTFQKRIETQTPALTKYGSRLNIPAPQINSRVDTSINYNFLRDNNIWTNHDHLFILLY